MKKVLLSIVFVSTLFIGCKDKEEEKRPSEAEILGAEVKSEVEEVEATPAQKIKALNEEIKKESEEINHLLEEL